VVIVRHPGDSRPGFHDHPGGLVPEDDWKRFDEVAVDDVEVARAHPASGHLYEHLALARLFEIGIHDLDWLPHAPEDGGPGFHRDSLESPGLRAAVLNAVYEPLSVDDVDLARPGPGEVAVRLRASGVCHSDWNVVSGVTSNPFPVVLGHEGAGVVEEVGEGVSGFAAGDHVVLSWLPSCGRCFYCSQGRPVLCEWSTPAMLAGTMPNGTTRLSRNSEPIYHYSFLSTFAERCVVPEGSCVPIRSDAPLEVAALVGCAVMTGIGAAMNRAKVEPGSVVAVFGAGGVGLSAVIGSRLAGAGTILAVDPFPFKRELALELGATHTLDPADGNVAAAVRKLTGGNGADYAFDAAGVGGLVRAAYDSVRPGGTVVAIGIPPEDEEVRLPGPQLPREEKIVTGSLYGSCRPHVDMPLVLDLFMAGRLPLDRLVTRKYSLDEINEAFAAMNAGEVARGVIVY
jgi:S-(hydroxymethyl)glutathione dehydrogenase / alcohol dehydrogenase